MRIAFVGKGGSGKTSMTALFSIVAKSFHENVLAIDADINMHLAEMLGFNSRINKDKHLSRPENMLEIKTYLKGHNKSIVAMGAFRKSTPPQSTSNFVIPHLKNDTITSKYAINAPMGVKLMSVGTYETDQVGSSCYHGSLAILENILSHMIDVNTLVVTDMVAGTDAFSNTLHAQFDLLVLVVEPTKRSIDVYKKYLELAKSAGIVENIAIVGNKAFDGDDVAFIEKNIDRSHLLGVVGESKIFKQYDRTGDPIDINNVDSDLKQLMQQIFDTAHTKKIAPNKRLEKIKSIHRKYIQKDFVTERYGDISSQIEDHFNIEKLFNTYE